MEFAMVVVGEYQGIEVWFGEGYNGVWRLSCGRRCRKKGSWREWEFGSEVRWADGNGSGFP